MLQDTVATNEIPDSDPRWKVRNSLLSFIREQFEDKFYIVDDFKFGHFTFVIRSNKNLQILVQDIDRENFEKKFQHFLEYEKVDPNKIKVQFLDAEEIENESADKIIRFDIVS